MATHICVFTAFSVVPKNDLMRRCCLIHLKNNSICQRCEELDIGIIAEGIETVDECKFLQDLGVNLMQGFLFSKPLFEACGQVEAVGWPHG